MSSVEAALVKETVTRLDIVAAAVLAYDYALTIHREATLVWPAPFTLGKVLFFLTRYPVLAETALVLYHQFGVMSPKTCTVVYKTIGYQLGTGTLIAEFILSVRTWVIWNRNPRIAIGLGIALVCCWTPVFYLLAQSLNSLVFAEPKVPGTPGCFLIKQKRILYVVFIIISCFETLILVLTLIKAVDHFRRTNSSLAKVLYRDGIMNYFYLFIFSIVNLAVITTASHGYTTLLTALQRAMHSILSARILLNLREHASNRVHTFDLTSHGAIDLYATPVRFASKSTAVASALQTSTWFGDESSYESSGRSEGVCATVDVESYVKYDGRSRNSI